MCKICCPDYIWFQTITLLEIKNHYTKAAIYQSTDMERVRTYLQQGSGQLAIPVKPTKLIWNTLYREFRAIGALNKTLSRDG